MIPLTLVWFRNGLHTIFWNLFWSKQIKIFSHARIVRHFLYILTVHTYKGYSVTLSNLNRSPDRQDQFHRALVLHSNWSTCQFAGLPFRPLNIIDLVVPATRQYWPFFVIPWFSLFRFSLELHDNVLNVYNFIYLIQRPIYITVHSLALCVWKNKSEKYLVLTNRFCLIRYGRIDSTRPMLNNWFMHTKFN